MHSNSRVYRRNCKPKTLQSEEKSWPSKVRQCGLSSIGADRVGFRPRSRSRSAGRARLGALSRPHDRPLIRGFPSRRSCPRACRRSFTYFSSAGSPPLLARSGAHFSPAPPPRHLRLSLSLSRFLPRMRMLTVGGNACRFGLPKTRSNLERAAIKTY